MLTVRTTPLRTAPVRTAAFDRSFDRAFDQLVGSFFERRPSGPVVDAAWQGDTYVLTVDLPGVPAGNVGVEVAGTLLTLSAVVDQAGQHGELRRGDFGNGCGKNRKVTLRHPAKDVADLVIKAIGVCIGHCPAIRLEVDPRKAVDRLSTLATICFHAYEFCVISAGLRATSDTCRGDGTDGPWRVEGSCRGHRPLSWSRGSPDRANT